MKGQQKQLRRPHGMSKMQPVGVMGVLEGVKEVLDKGKDKGEVGEVGEPEYLCHFHWNYQVSQAAG